MGSDDKETAKFRRLMGISKSTTFSSHSPYHPLFKFNPSTTGSAAASASMDNKEVQDEHSKRMNVLEHQFESSRYQTHIARGVGLGYGTAALTTELPSQKDTGDKLDEKL